MTTAVGKKMCTGPECDRVAIARGLCDSHYAQHKRGSKLKPIREYRTIGSDGKSKRCAACKMYRPFSDFGKNVRGTGGMQAYCKDCRVRLHVESYNPDRVRNAHLRRNYGLSLEEYEAILAAQGGVCARCGASSPGGRGAFHVDHAHSCCPGIKSCGKCVRGLLCSDCNKKLGFVEMYKADPSSWDVYLESFSNEKVDG